MALEVQTGTDTFAPRRRDGLRRNAVTMCGDAHGYLIGNGAGAPSMAFF